MKNNFFKIKFAFFLLVFISSTLLFSQNNNFRQWSIKEGLPQSNIYCMKQDKRGYLWLGTGAGVCQFDGKKFRSYSKKDGFNGNSVRCIMEDHLGRLWFGSDQGIEVYDGYKFKSLGKSRGLLGSSVLCLLEDDLNTIWAGTDDGGLNQIISLGKDSFKITDTGKKLGLDKAPVFDLLEDANKKIWVATFAGIAILIPKGDTYDIQNLSGSSTLPSDRILCISKDAKGFLWFGTYDAGVFRLNADGTGILRYSKENGLSGNSVWKIIFSSKGEGWIATSENGINRFIPGKGKMDYYTSKQGLASDQILSLLEDTEGDIWIGTNGDGLCELPGDRFSHYSEKDGLPANKITGIDQDAEGNLWVSSDGGGLSRVNFSTSVPVVKTFNVKDGLSSNFISSIAIGKGSNSNSWIGTTNQGIMKYDGHQFKSFREGDGLQNDRINKIMVDSKGIVWCGTADGISRYDGVRFLNSSTSTMKMENYGVKTMIEDKKGNTWFGTAGGLARYTGDGIIRTFDEAEGLKQKDVNSIAEGPDGNIWIGTNTGGLYRYNAQKSDSIAIEFVADDSLLASNSIHMLLFEDNLTLIAGTNKGFDKISLDATGKILKVQNYNATDGFTGLECNDNAIYKDKKGAIWFGTVKGLTRYSPSLDFSSKIPPLVHVSDLQLFYKKVDWSSKSDSLLPWSRLPASLTLKYDENNLTFYFSAISLNNPEKIRYRYKLEGREKEWTPPRTEDRANFSGLSEGKYTFKVMACDASGNWSEPSEFNFIILPPWYRTIWFYLICLIVVVSSTYAYIRYRESALKEEKRILENIVVERTKVISEQKDHLAEKNREILDSITYAKRIQNSILPPKETIKAAFQESFVLYKPKDIVSGDLYWFHKTDRGFLLAAADCTGHGIPGAFMSIVAYEKLTEAALFTSDVGELLSLLNKGVKRSLRQSDHEGSTRDGMDIAVCHFDLKTRTVEYAAANRPLWIVKKGGIEVVEIKATKNAIGGLTKDDQQYQKHVIDLQQGDTVYLSSDGYADQFGHNNKKMMTKRFKEVIMSIQDRNMEDQCSYLDEFYDKWKGKFEQIDDVLVVGVKMV
jgi:ligand-binding sensor domain-containing protein/serine phosphatase RsbU (regulator of sigma subunit)